MKNLHIVNGGSAAGTLKHFFKEGKKDNTNTVYCFNDFLSVGPLLGITTKKGIEERSRYLHNMVNKVSDKKIDIGEIEDDMIHFLNYNFSDYDRVVIWYGANAPEELLRLLCCHLVNKSRLYTINVSTGHDDNHTLRSVGECSPEIIKKLFPQATRISLEAYDQGNGAWKRTSLSKSLVRIYESGKIKEVGEDYFDARILERCTNTYVPLLRIAGEVMGVSEQLITDTFIINRILFLIETEQIQYAGNIDTIRALQIKK